MNTPYTFEKDFESKIDAIEKKFDDAQAEIIIYSNKLHKPIFEERDEALKSVNKFWTKALSNCAAVMIYIDDEDKPVFDYLSAVRVERGVKDVREATLHLDFEPNDYFTNTTLTRSFKLKEGAGPLGPEFDFPENMKTEDFVIDWKSDEKNQAKLRPTKMEDEDDFEPGSFFSSFFDSKLENLVLTIGDVLINDFYPRAIDYYTGKATLDDFYLDGEEDDEDDEEDEEDDSDDDREIDLEEEENRPKKKVKN